jgi:hypothetical protein
MPPSVPPARPVGADHPVSPRTISSWPASRACGRLEAVADLDALDRLDAHERAGQPGVEAPVPVHVAAQARRQAVDEHLDDAAEGVAVLAGGVDLGDHRGARAGVEAAHRVGVDGVEVVRARAPAAGRHRRPDAPRRG